MRLTCKNENQSFSRAPPPFLSSSSQWDLWQEDRLHPYFPISPPPQELGLPHTNYLLRPDCRVGETGKSKMNSEPLHCGCPASLSHSMGSASMNLSTLHRYIVVLEVAGFRSSLLPRVPPSAKGSPCVPPRTGIWGTKLKPAALLGNPVLSYYLLTFFGVLVSHISPLMLQKCIALFPPPISICKALNRDTFTARFSLTLSPLYIQ